MTPRLRRREPGAGDRLYVGVVITSTALLVIGLVMDLSASSVRSIESTGSAFTLFGRQALWATLGLLALVVCSRIDYRKLRGWSYGALPFVWVFLMATLLPGVGTNVGGATRWIDVGPFTFQPSELAKLAVVLYGADLLSRKLDRLDDWRHGLAPFLVPVGVTCLLVLMQPDFGTMLVIGGVAMCVAFLAGTPLRLLGSLVAVTLAVGAPVMMLEGYRRARIFSFLGGTSDCLNTAYQACQGLVALGSGRLLGLGLGSSRQKYRFLPNPDTDFIFAIIGEELGLIGTLTVLLLFAVLAVVGIRVARQARDAFGFLIAAGVTVWITLQAAINICTVTGLLPVTGVPLPLLSFGGTSLLVSLAGLGLMASVARSAREPKAGRRAKRAEPARA